MNLKNMNSGIERKKLTRFTGLKDDEISIKDVYFTSNIEGIGYTLFITEILLNPDFKT